MGCAMVSARQPDTHVMVSRRLAAAALAAACLSPAAVAQTQALRAASLSQALSGLEPAGQAQMRFLGLRIYALRLWVSPGFDPQTPVSQPVALELTYQRGFTAQAIAERSVQEIRRQRSLSPQEAADWTAMLAGWLPDVAPGDRLTGLLLPGQGMQLWRGELSLGWLAEPQLAAYFFGIWLSPQTSEPGLRQALLAGR